MLTKTITVKIPSGLEARPVAVLVQIANQFSSSIYIANNSRRVNAKSIMGLMALGLRAGEKLVIEAKGDDEEAAIAKIEEYLTGNGQRVN